MELRNRRRKIGTAILAAFFILLAAYIVKIQFVDGYKYKEAAESLAVSSMTVKAARGEILDCNGNPLVTNRQGFNIVFKYNVFPSSKNQSDRNSVILSLINLFEKNEAEWKDICPIEETKEGKFVISEERQAEFEYLISDNMLSLDKKATAKDCLDGLIERYMLEDYSRSDARKIASVCFGMKYTSYGASNPYIFAEDVPSELVSTILENSTTFPGVESESVGYREYANKTDFSHILGVVGSINAEEYEAEQKALQEELNNEGLTKSQIMSLKNNAYTLSDTYGKSGIESVCEKYLRGTNGIKTVSTGKDGSQTEDYIVKPSAGNTVVLTIDSKLQEVAAKALETTLRNNQDNGIFAKAGALVVENIKTGEILACVSYPSYDITEYFSKYSELVENTGSPLWNRALLGTYAPGSTLKPAIATAGLEEGIITPTSTICCTEAYVVEDHTFHCLNEHGFIPVTTALQQSCNIFFFETGSRLGIDKMNKYCALFGLGQKTGIELPEAEGMLASVANKEANGEVWNPGDTVQAAIGQSDNTFTPIQLCNYCAMIANGGTRYKTHIVKSVLSDDMSEVIEETQPEVVNTLNVKKRTLNTVRKGMREVVTMGSCHTVYADCKIHVAGKTGTSELLRKTVNGETMECNNGFFISFAPYEDPEIAIAVVAENASSGSIASRAALEVYNYYFSQKSTYEHSTVGNTLIP